MSLLTKLTNNVKSCFNTSVKVSEELPKADKDIIISTYNILLQADPELFSKAWIMSASRSTSIRKAFSLIDPNSTHIEVDFTKFSAVIERFFTRIICEEKLVNESFEKSCINLGKKHVDFVPIGFHSNYWDIFMNCMIDVIAETVIIAFNEDNKQQQQVQKCWNKFVGRIVFLMQSGFKQRQLVEKNVDKKNNDKGANGNNF
ncbi:Globin-like domain and Globin, structural domain-containing protein [Strongyloides ratti]|uniref:Globin-like domain and Globin, structural domain-containing protein n=1 Tax=Strongyloides ratti TaxID=34506 RepID=A0A090LKP0_STRRB|nr:Globin-like domain and Globin, structural domain-containing protein [Strongyloides ratti]CEF68703.1 Globin-like domain and Globin, structural domain-containing protein [Strongyloides ratti]